MKFFYEDDDLSKKIIKFRNEIEKLFHNNFGLFNAEDLPYSFKTNSAAYAPIDIYTNENTLTVEIELPGIKKDNIVIGIHHNVLVVRWKAEKADKTKPAVNFHCLERRFGRFEKFVLLPVSPLKENTNASLSNGVLKISFDISGLFVNFDTLISIPVS